MALTRRRPGSFGRLARGSASTHGHRLHDAATTTAGAGFIIILTAMALAQGIDADGDRADDADHQLHREGIAGWGQELAPRDSLRSNPQ